MDRDPSWTPCCGSSHGDMSDMAKSPCQVACTKGNKENVMEELHTRAWHTELLKESLVQSAKDLNKLQEYLAGHWMVNGAQLEFHPNIKLRHVLQTIFFSDQGGSWHCLQYICRVASVASEPPCPLEIWATKGQITSTSLGRTIVAPSLLQLQPLRMARLGWFPSQANFPRHGFWRQTWQMSHWAWNARSTVRKARSSRTQNQSASSWENWSLPTTSQLHFFALQNPHLGPI